MAIYIDAILFNIDPAIGAGAINIRVNAFHSVTLPEWREGLHNARDAPAAYSLADNKPGKMLIQARFRRDTGEESVWIEAVDGSPDKKNTLGSISRFRIDFHDNDERVITIPISEPKSTAVGFHDDVWNWNYTVGDEQCCHAGTTKHRIYTLLKKPGPPWNVDSSNSYLWPWQDVLDIACTWANGASTEQDAARRIGQAIMGYGNETPYLRYDIRDTDNFFVNDPSFDCIEFLRTAKNKPCSIHKANCSDFASMISTAANAVGCELSTVVLRSEASPPFFITNQVQPLGQACFAGPFHFRYHEIGFSGEVGADGTVWDTCFYLDGDGDPTSPPHTAKSSLGLTFGNPGDLQYLDRLVRPSSRVLVTSNMEKPNRSVTPLIEPAGARSGPTFPSPLDISSNLTPSPTKVFIFKLFLAGVKFDRFNLKRMIFPRLANADASIDSFWQSEESSDFLFRLRIDIAPSISAGLDMTFSSLTKFSIPLVEPSAKTQLIFPVMTPDNVGVVANVGNLAVQVHNVGIRDEDVTNFYRQLFELVTHYAIDATDLGTIQLPPPIPDGDVRIVLKDLSGLSWFKLFTSTGDLFSERDQMFYAPGQGIAHHEIDVLEMRGMAAYRRYRYKFSMS